MPPRWPDTFIVGAPRCGTTAMHEHLRRHPDIYMCPTKEPLFFADDLPGIPGARVSDPQAYLALFAGKNRSRLGEASPYYLYSPSATAAIARHSPDARIVIMLRHPADMMYSMYWAWSYAGFEHARTFEGALLNEASTPAEQIRFILRYRHLANVRAHVERYLEAFGRHRIHVVVFDDLTRDPTTVHASVCDFLGVPVHTTPSSLNAAERAASRRPFSRRLARVVTGRRMEIGGSIGRRFTSGVRTAVRRWGSQAPPALPPDFRRRIGYEFADETERLGHLIGKDLRAWQ